ncbi:NAD(P)-dependent oxidoreductase [Nocardioides sp. Iso805N]|uniref:NAD(P)-dependent oxidoreductase n=1 Tax=Nocardioides sp. Iso805N TaxID=1283287 RepID=UPI000364CDEB|nr:NAD(P)-dependent oxidoreductase [Nocardioides sp. Iso805N]
MADIGFVGPGQLGLPMVERLLGSGHALTVHARRPDVRQQLEDLGATSTDDLTTVARDSDVVIVCVFSDDQLREVGPALIAAMSSGSTLVSHVTGTVALIRSLAASGAERRVSVVDAPVSGTADDIRNGRLTVLLGGDEEPRDRVAGIVSAYADSVLPAGGLGTALATKLINNLLFSANVQLVAEAVRLGRDLGIESTTLLTALAHSSGGSYASTAAAQHESMEIFGTQIGRFLAKDVAACKAQAADLGVDPGLLTTVVADGPLALA